MPIRILPEHVANRIAAGEIAESPASIVKELVENSLDASAKHVAVHVRGGGRTLIEVCDDGSGMTPDDLRLCLHRHATSKLPEDDLSRVSTFGFRGEALTAISSVSVFSVRSRTRDAECGWSTESRYGSKPDVRPCSLAPGSAVSVRDLFGNVPARLKFLKSEAVESAAVRDVVCSVALGNPSVGFRLITNGKNVFSADPCLTDEDFLLRVALVLGDEFVPDAVQVCESHEDMSLSGWISLPTHDSKSSGKQYFFVNGRLVRDKVLAASLKAAYADLGDGRKRQAAVLNLRLPLDEVDVNVHPSKTEVKFRRAGEVSRRATALLKSALAKSGCRTSSQVASSAFEAMALSADAEEARPTLPLLSPLGKVIGQAHASYVVSETADGLVIVDQHAAHERIVHERMKKAVRNGGVEKRTLPRPEIVEVGYAEAASLEEASDRLDSFGLAVRSFGDSAVIVESVPAILGAVDVSALVKAVAAKLVEDGCAHVLSEMIDEVCGTLACHRAVRAGDALDAREMDALLREMESTPNSGQCNHGRPTFVFLSLDSVERLFERR